MSSEEFRKAFLQVCSKLTPPEQVEQPVLIILSGLPGTGKSTLARKLSKALPALVVESDLVRKTLFPKPSYSSEENRFVHGVARACIRRFLKSGHNVVVDSTNLIEWHRRLLGRTAQAAGSPSVVIQVLCSVPTVQKRLQRRFQRRAPDDLSDADWKVYELLARSARPIQGPHIRVVASQDMGRAVDRVARAVRRAARAR